MPSIMERKELSEALSKDRASLIFCTKLVGGVILKEQNRKTEAASENRKRGRPPIDIGITSYLDGTRRTKVNAKYMYEAISLISEAASEIKLTASNMYFALTCVRRVPPRHEVTPMSIEGLPRFLFSVAASKILFSFFIKFNLS